MTRAALGTSLALLAALAGAAGCKKKPTEQAQFVEDMTDLCNAFSRSGAAPGDFSAAVAWVAKRGRTSRFRGELSTMATLGPGEKIARLETMMKAAGILDCPFRDTWKQGAGKTVEIPTCEEVRTAFMRQLAAKHADEIEAAPEADRARLEADALTRHERIKTGFLDACQKLTPTDLACLAKPVGPVCEEVATRLETQLSAAAPPALPAP